MSLNSVNSVLQFVSFFNRNGVKITLLIKIEDVGVLQENLFLVSAANHFNMLNVSTEIYPLKKYLFSV